MRTVKLKKPLEEKRGIQTDISNCLTIGEIIQDESRDQLDLINRLYLDETFPERTIILRDIKAKIAGYRQQDIDKNIYDSSSIISLEQVTEKLVASRLKCIYCTQRIKLLYKNQREPLQWTLDRKNNNLDHSNDNTAISCLKCNLERRRRNMRDFQFSNIKG
jgi:hypothetical protein